MNLDKSFALTGLSYLFAFGLVAAKVFYNYEIDDPTYKFILTLVGSTTFAGVVNAGRKHFLEIKSKLKT